MRFDTFEDSEADFRSEEDRDRVSKLHDPSPSFDSSSSISYVKLISKIVPIVETKIIFTKI